MLTVKGSVTSSANLTFVKPTKARPFAQIISNLTSNPARQTGVEQSHLLKTPAHCTLSPEPKGPSTTTNTRRWAVTSNCVPVTSPLHLSGAPKFTDSVNPDVITFLRIKELSELKVI